MKAREKREQKGVWKRIAPCLYRYNDASYYAVVKRDGKLIRKRLKADGLEMAKRLLRDFLNEQAHAAPDAHRVRLDEYADDFLAGKTGAPKTLKRYQKQVADMKASWPGGAHQPLRDVDLSQCKRWLGQWNGKIATYEHARQWLLAFFDYAVANRKIARSPVDKKLVPTLKRPKVKRNAPSQEEFDAILAEVRGRKFTDHADDTADVIEFMGRGGVGEAETKGLRWQDVSFEVGTLTLFRVKTKTAFTIPIFPKLRPFLERLRKETAEALPADPVFKIKCPKVALASACRRLKLPNYSPRSLRRMFIIEALERGVLVKTISQWQGHQDGGVLILKTYSEVIGRQANQEAAKLLA